MWNRIPTDATGCTYNTSNTVANLKALKLNCTKSVYNTLTSTHLTVTSVAGTKAVTAMFGLC